MLRHQPRRGAVIQLDLGDGVGLAQAGGLGGGLQARGALEGEAGQVCHGAGCAADAAEEGDGGGGGFGAEVGEGAAGGDVHTGGCGWGLMGWWSGWPL